MTTPSTSPQLRTDDSIALPREPAATVEARSSREDIYPISVTRSLRDTVNRIVELVGDARIALLSDDRVYELHGRRLQSELDAVGLPSDVLTIPNGEANKSLEEAVRAWNWLAESSLGRHDVLVNVGGGVVIDLGGWVASGYMRGMRYLNVPTTLVGQVDAGIGGKVAVNHPRAKNLIGGFHQPIGVVSNVGYLATLEQRAVNAGVSETIKKAVVASPAYFEFIEKNADSLLAGDEDSLIQLVGWAGVIKAELIARDPYEYDSRRTLGFGHGLAHPLETVTGFGPIVHGEAVAFGMSIEARLALARGLLDRGTYNRILGLLARFGQPVCADDLPVSVDWSAVLVATEMVRLARGGLLRDVLPCALGETVIADDVTDHERRAALIDAGGCC